MLAGGRTTVRWDVPDWPPPGADALDVAGRYGNQSGAGLNYGPAFQGVRAAWRRGAEVFAEIALPDGTGDAGGYGMHPALLDAALQAYTLIGGQAPKGSLPFSWRGVSLHAAGADAVRVRWTGDGDTMSLAAVDADGAPVISVDELVVRPAPAQLPTRSADSLFQVSWEPLPTGLASPAPRWVVVGVDELGLAVAVRAAGATVVEAATLAEVLDAADVPDVVLVPLVAHAPATVPGSVHEAVADVLGVVQRWLADERFTAARLVFLTRGAVAAEHEAVVDLAGSAAWGLLRSAQAENPGRVLLADVDDDITSLAVVPSLAGLFDAAEPQAAVRGGGVRVPRLTRPAASGARAAAWNPDGTVLITGGTGGLGAQLARHLVAERGVRHLVLAGRRGAVAPGADQLCAELAAVGAEVRVIACDVGDRAAVADLVAAVPAAHPLTAVVHAAGVLDDGLVQSLTQERLSAVLRSKVDGAWHLHEATLDDDLAAFVLFSSIAGVLGGPAQGSYAAANAFLDGFASWRRGHGLPATSLAWGPWAQETGMTSMLTENDRRRIARSGMPPIDTEQGTAMFDAALTLDAPLTVAVRLNTAALRAQGPLPTLFHGLVPAGRRPAARSAPGSAASVVDRLRGLDSAGQQRLLRELVVDCAADALGHQDSSAVDPDRDFFESGFDSLISVQLRNTLSEALGLRLPTILVTDHPTPTLLARWLHTQLADRLGAGGPVTTGDRADPDTVGSLFFGAVQSGKLTEGLDMLKAVAAIRPTFDMPAELEELPHPVTLAEGTGGPRLICISSPVLGGGVHQYARLAAHFRGRRTVLGLPLVGFAPGERLPASADALCRVVSESVLHASDGEPFVLIGHSSAGVLAYAAAGFLEQTWGVRPEGVVLLDTLSLRYGVNDTTEYLDLVRDAATRLAGDTTVATGVRLSAMARWLNRLPHVDILPTTVPKLLIRCGAAPDVPAEQREMLAQEDTVRSIDADHFSVIGEDAERTARLLTEWFASLPVGVSSR
jgi:polyene macrolide polyketide synthase